MWNRFFQFLRVFFSRLDFIQNRAKWKPNSILNSIAGDEDNTKSIRVFASIFGDCPDEKVATQTGAKRSDLLAIIAHRMCITLNV